MEYFTIGTISFVFAALFPILYLLGFNVRRLCAWSKRAEGPKDRVSFFLFVTAVFGFALGCFAQPQWDKMDECEAQGQPVISCMFFPK